MLTKEVYGNHSALRSVSVVLEFVRFIEVFHESDVLFQTGLRRVLIVLLFLTFGPDHVHDSVDDRMIGRFGSCENGKRFFYNVGSRENNPNVF